MHLRPRKTRAGVLPFIPINRQLSCPCFLPTTGLTVKNTRGCYRRKCPPGAETCLCDSCGNACIQEEVRTQQKVHTSSTVRLHSSAMQGREGTGALDPPGSQPPSLDLQPVLTSNSVLNCPESPVFMCKIQALRKCTESILCTVPVNAGLWQEGRVA